MVEQSREQHLGSAWSVRGPAGALKAEALGGSAVVVVIAVMILVIILVMILVMIVMGMVGLGHTRPGIHTYKGY